MTVFHTPNYVGPFEEQCGEKRRYLTKAIAKRQRQRLCRQEHRDNLHPYRCPHCNFWHLGNR